MNNKLSHKDWISALNNNELSVVDIIEAGMKFGQKFSWHPLGFILCKLSEEREKKIRIHIWPNDNDRVQNPAWLIHDHLFDLKSWVISGEIENTEYWIKDEIPNYCLYEAKYENDSSILCRTNKKVYISLKSKTLVRSGEVYEVPSDVLHQSLSVSKAASLTVCETIDKLGRSPIIAGDIDGLDFYTYERSEVTENELQDVISKI